MARKKSKWDIPADAADANNGASSSNSAVEAAKERAAKLTAMLAAKGKLAKNTGSILPLISQAVAHTGSPVPKVEKDQDIVTAEVEINDSPARTKLCKGTTQDEISRYSGAAVSTKGRFMDAEERKQDQDGARPLYLCIQGTSQDKVDMALQRINEIMSKAEGKSSSQTRWSPYEPCPPPVINTGHLPVSNTQTHAVPTQALPTGMHYVQDKVFVGLDHICSTDFDVKEKLLGPGGSYFQHITTQTGAKIFLRGKGSGFLEPTSGREAFEALHIYISHSKPEGLSAAKSLVQNLIQTVNTEYQAFEQMKRAQQVGHLPGYPPPIPAYMPPIEYSPRPGMLPPPPGAGYPGPVPPPPPQYYGHPPPPGQPQPPPPGPYGQAPPPPPGYGIPPPPRGQTNGGPPTTYPGYPPHQAPPPPAVTYPPRPSVPPDNGPPRSQPNIPIPEIRQRGQNNRENFHHENPFPKRPSPKEQRRRFKEATRTEPPQESQPRTFQESETSSLGTRPQERPVVMPPPLMGQLRSQSKPSEDFKKPVGPTQPFLLPPSPKDIIKKESTTKKLQTPGTTRKHGLPTTADTLASSSKKAKKEEEQPALMPLVAYDGDSSSEEEDEQTPPPLTAKGRTSPMNKTQTLPFWAVKK